MRLGFTRRNRHAISITKVNIMWKGTVHVRDGLVSNTSQFTLELPFHNKASENMLTKQISGSAVLKAQDAPTEKVTKVESSPPFTLVSIKPSIPLEIEPNAKTTFEIVLLGPDHGYSGPLNLMLVSEGDGLVHIEITKVVLLNNGRSVDIENSSRIFDVPKGQIFTQRVQLYKLMGHRDKVADIEVNAPFEIVSQDPNPPFSLDDPNSAVETLYITAPHFNYAGILEIHII